MALLQEAGVACISDEIPDVDAVVLDADEASPYLRPAVVDHLQNEGARVYRFDSTAVDRGLPVLWYRVAEARIDLDRAGGGMVDRRASVSLHAALYGPDGNVLADSFCSADRNDRIPASGVSALTDSRFPETNVTIESRNLLRRLVEPAVIVGAAVIGTYLFFNLRSKRTEGG